MFAIDTICLSPNLWNINVILYYILNEKRLLKYVEFVYYMEILSKNILDAIYNRPKIVLNTNFFFVKSLYKFTKLR